MMDFNGVVKQYKNFLYKESWKWQMNYDFEELYQMAMIGCWKAFMHYTGEVLFLTYAARCIQNEILMYVRKCQGCKSEDKQVKFIVNLEAVIGTNKDGQESLLQDTIGATDDDIEEYGEREIKRKLLKKLSKRQWEEIECVLFKSTSQKELSEKYGVSQSYISRRAQATLDRLKINYLKEMSL